MKKIMRELYSDKMQAARKEFADSPVLKELFDLRIDPHFLELFLIYFSAIKVGFTEFVPEAMHKAGERCRELGYHELVDYFQNHGKEEKGHHFWAMADTRKLVENWNRRREPKLDAEELIAQRLTPGVKRYRELRAQIITGNTPFVELTFSMEIEVLAVKYGPRMLLQCLLKVGPKITGSLSFVKKHFMADLGHNHENNEILETFLEKHPEHAGAFVEYGKLGISAYHGFLSDCLRSSKEKFQTVLSLSSR